MSYLLSQKGGVSELNQKNQAFENFINDKSLIKLNQLQSNLPQDCLGQLSQFGLNFMKRSDHSLDKDQLHFDELETLEHLKGSSIFKATTVKEKETSNPGELSFKNTNSVDELSSALQAQSVQASQLLLNKLKEQSTRHQQPTNDDKELDLRDFE